MTHKNQIVFISKQAKIDFCHEWDKRLAPEITRISWSLVNAERRDALYQDCSPEAVPYLWLSTPETRAACAPKINDLRSQHRRPIQIIDHGNVHLRAIRTSRVDFLGTNLPKLLVGELIYAYEVLTYRLVRATRALQSVLARLEPYA